MAMHTDSRNRQAPCKLLEAFVAIRDEDAAMREKLIAHDVLDCVPGLGPNLFYNSPMEACIVICRMHKPKARRNKVLLINAVNEVTRERAQSFLTDDHIQRIVDAYRQFEDVDGFARVVSNSAIQDNGNNLSIPLYVRPETSSRIMEEGSQGNGNGDTLKQAIANWQESSRALRESMTELFDMLEKGQ